MELLQQDKTYLSREVEEARERERKREEEEDRLREKVRTLRAARDDLREKVLGGHAEMRSQHEERLTAEVSRLQRKANEDLERLREEHGAHRDREIRALRDLPRRRRRRRGGGAPKWRRRARRVRRRVRRAAIDAGQRGRVAQRAGRRFYA